MRCSFDTKQRRRNSVTQSYFDAFRVVWKSDLALDDTVFAQPAQLIGFEAAQLA